MREIESIYRIFAEYLADDNFRANLIEDIGNVIEEILCIVEKRGAVSSKIEDASFRNVNQVKRKHIGSVSPASVNCGPWQCADLQTNRMGEISRQIQWSENLGDLKGERPKVCADFNPLVDPKVHEFKSEEKISTWAVVDFQNDRRAVQRPQN